MVRVAMSDEFAGLFAMQYPGNVSKIATLISPPTFTADGEAALLPVEATVDTAIVAAIAAPTRRITRDRVV
jgi:hypothetical protein